MRNPGIAKEYFKLIELGCAWSLELRTFMALLIAEKLQIDPRMLPQMQDDQLWMSFKTAVGTGDAALLPDVFNEHQDLTHSLSIGEATAVTLGRCFDTSALPEGECLQDLLDHTSLDQTDKESLLYGALVIAVANGILANLEHPALIDWELRDKRYPKTVLNDRTI